VSRWGRCQGGGGGGSDLYVSRFNVRDLKVVKHCTGEIVLNILLLETVYSSRIRVPM